MYPKPGKQIPKIINKRTFELYLSNKINYVVHNLEIMGIIAVLIREIAADLIKGKTIRIFNFGKIKLKKMPPRSYFDLVNQKVMKSDGKRSMRFTLNKKILETLTDHLDIEKTFDDSNEEK